LQKASPGGEYGVTPPVDEKFCVHLIVAVV
jgi:hypothetical protein